MGDLKEGLYEELIHELLQEGLVSSSEAGLVADIRSLDPAEVKYVLAKYLLQVTQKALGYLECRHGRQEEQALARVQQVDTCNRLIAQLSELPDCDFLRAYQIDPACKQLYSLLNPCDAKELLRPETSLSLSTLFTGSRAEPSMVQELGREFASADRVDILVSFIKWSGILQLMPALEHFTRGGKMLRIITTSYMGATDPKAIAMLKKLPHTQIKVSYNTKATRLHAKAYMFYRDTGFSTAYIGSSNLSAAAISSGLEWNVKATEQDMPHVLRSMEAAFESYWNDGDFVDFSLDDLPRLEQAIHRERYPDSKEGASSIGELSCIFRIEPYPFQKEILDKLQAQRELHHRSKNLLVAATGTGKTVISAFDYKRFCKLNASKRNRLLFVAHREEILQQSLACFRGILGDSNFGDILCSGFTPAQYDYLFVSIQSLNSRALTQQLDASFYDFIVVDEFHHACAPSYQDLLNYFRPQVLLGLTATPERMDGGDICADYFDNVTAAEIRLPEAINRQLLVPFQYFGVSDSTDLSGVKFTRGGYDVAELSHVYTANDARTENIRRALLHYVTDINDVVGLGFCVSVEHAKYMAHKFCDCGIPALALHGDSSREERRAAKNKLVSKEVHFIFTVDLYNEGVDIPEVNTILFLRPSESLTVFLQQLGRGLRLCDGKELLTVLDFIGQQHAKYSFENKFKSLLDKSCHSILKEASAGFRHLPLGCSIQFEKVAMQTVLKNLKSLTMDRRRMIARIKSFERDTGQKVSLKRFLQKYDCDLLDVYRHGLFSRLCMEAGVMPSLVMEQESKIHKLFLRLVNVDSRKWIEFLQIVLAKGSCFEAHTQEEQCMLSMLYYSMDSVAPLFMGLNRDADLLLPLRASSVFEDELTDLLQLRYESLNFVSKSITGAHVGALELHCTYTRDQVLAGLGYWDFAQRKEHREGVLYFKEKKLHVFFVTINKSEKGFSPSTMYEDYAINEKLFHWQSQSTTTALQGIGLRYINHLENGEDIVLFIRENKKERNQTQAYTFLGKARYLRHRGSRPMSIELELEEAMPAHVFSYAAQAL